MTRLGETIRAARVKAKMTPKALARKCGVSESFVNEVELGRRILSDDQAQRMLKVLGVKDPISNELAVANEPEQAPRPRPRPYVMPLPKEDHSVPTPREQSAAQESADAWLDALGGVVIDQGQYGFHIVKRRFSITYHRGSSQILQKQTHNTLHFILKCPGWQQ